MTSINLAIHSALLVILSCTTFDVLSQCFTENDDNVSPGTTSTNTYADGSIDFAVALFKSVSGRKTGKTDNVFISPFSVHSALTITYIGTKGNTKAELENGLHLGNSNQKQVITAYHEYKDGLLHNATKNANYTFSAANKLYFDETVQLRKCIVDYMNEENEKLNFIGSPDPSREIINKWVEDQTNKKIVNLIPKGYIDSNTRIVVVNAAYFKGYWLEQFQEVATEKQDFFIDINKKIKTDMMQQRRKTFLVAADPTLECLAIELPYSGNKISMVILLPNENIKIEDLIAKIDKKSLRNLYTKLNSNLVNLSIPKFTIEQSMELTNEISSLGINDLFNQKADLSGFTGSGGMFVSFVQHKTYIAVNEGGTEAAAATAVGMSRTSIHLRQPVNIVVNRPFVFLIREQEDNSILFIGTIRDPSSSN